MAPTVPKLVLALCALPAMFLICYSPAFAVVQLIDALDWRAIAAVVVVSGFMAVTAMLALVRFRSWELQDFGFVRMRLVEIPRIYGLAFIAAWPLLWWISSGNDRGPEFIQALSFWQKLGFFVVMASCQEELIFRGLFLGALKRLSGLVVMWPLVLVVAVLFGGIHAEAGLRTAVVAFLLGLATGYLRFHKNFGLFGAVACHSAFNLCSLLQPYALR